MKQFEDLINDLAKELDLIPKQMTEEKQKHIRETFQVLADCHIEIRKIFDEISDNDELKETIEDFCSSILATVKSDAPEQAFILEGIMAGIAIQRKISKCECNCQCDMERK